MVQELPKGPRGTSRYMRYLKFKEVPKGPVVPKGPRGTNQFKR